MKMNKTERLAVFIIFVFCLAVPSYSASKKKGGGKKSVDAVSAEILEAGSDSDAAVEDAMQSEGSEQSEPEKNNEGVKEESGEEQNQTLTNNTDNKKKTDGDNKEKESKTKKSKSKKKSKKELQKEKNNYSGWIDPKGRGIDGTYGALKLRIKSRIGSFNVAAYDDESKKNIYMLSTSDEYTTSGFNLRVGKKNIELGKDSSVKKSAWETDSGAAIGYRIDNVADVIVYFDVFRSSNDYDVDSVKITVKVTNMGKKRDVFAVKVLLDTILGETDRHHFYDCENNPVKNEIAFRNLDENKWFLSKNSSGALQIIVNGGECTVPELVALANYSTLNTRNWEPDLLTYRAFDTVLAYNNSAVGITWPNHKLGADEQFTEVFYLSTALGDRIPPGADFVLGVERKTEEPLTVEDSEEKSADSVTEEKDAVLLPPYVPFDVKSLTKQQLSPEYIQQLLNRISVLEESDDSVDREELVLLNAELDAILEALRFQ